LLQQVKEKKKMENNNNNINNNIANAWASLGKASAHHTKAMESKDARDEKSARNHVKLTLYHLHRAKQNLSEMDKDRRINAVSFLRNEFPPKLFAHLLL